MRSASPVIDLLDEAPPAMSGWEKRTDRVITDERRLENADSYAWAARRIWKHKTGFRRDQAA